MYQFYPLQSFLPAKIRVIARTQRGHNIRFVIRATMPFIEFRYPFIFASIFMVYMPILLF